MGKFLVSILSLFLIAGCTRSSDLSKVKIAKMESKLYSQDQLNKAVDSNILLVLEKMVL